jgi:hypothetical protein
VSGRGTTLVLARVEGRRLLHHPFVLAGAAVPLAGAFLAVLFLDEADADGYAWSLLVPFLPFAVAVLVAINLAALRGVRDDADELYRSLPTPARARTAGHLVSLAWALAATALLVTISVVAFMSRGGPLPSLLQVAMAMAIVALCGALGLALARALPHPAAATIGVVGIFVLVNLVGPAESRWGLLVPGIVGLAILLGALCLLRDRSRLA